VVKVVLKRRRGPKIYRKPKITQHVMARDEFFHDELIQQIFVEEIFEEEKFGMHRIFLEFASSTFEFFHCEFSDLVW